jgi:hypothetical protein
MAYVYRARIRKKFPLRYYLWQPQSACWTLLGLARELVIVDSQKKEVGSKGLIRRGSVRCHHHHYIFKEKKDKLHLASNTDPSDV